MSRTLIRPFSLLLDQAVKRFGKVRMLFDSSEPLQTTKQRVLSKRFGVVRSSLKRFERVEPH